MGQQRGSSTVIIYDTETTFKTTPGAPDAVVMAFVTESLRMSRNLLTSASITSSRNPLMPVRGNLEVGGDINFELSPQQGRLFKHLFGGYTHTIPAGGLTTWTFTIDDLPAGMMIEKQFTDITTPTYYQYNGCKINSFKCAVKTEGFVDCSVSVLGAKETLAAASFDATATDLGHTPFDGFGATLKQGGVTMGVVTNFDFTMENGLSADTFVLDGTGQRYSLVENKVKVSGNLTALFISNTLYEMAVNNTETSLEIDFVRGTGAGTDGNEKLSFFMDEVVLKPQAPVISGPTGLVVEIPFEAYYDDASAASALRAVLLCPNYTF